MLSWKGLAPHDCCARTPLQPPPLHPHVECPTDTLRCPDAADLSVSCHGFMQDWFDCMLLWGGRFRAQLTHLFSLVHAMAVQHLRTDWDLCNIQPHSTACGAPPQVKLLLQCISTGTCVLSVHRSYQARNAPRSLRHRVPSHPAHCCILASHAPQVSGPGTLPFEAAGCVMMLQPWEAASSRALWHDIRRALWSRSASGNNREKEEQSRRCHPETETPLCTSI